MASRRSPYLRRYDGKNGTRWRVTAPILNSLLGETKTWTLDVRTEAEARKYLAALVIEYQRTEEATGRGLKRFTSGREALGRYLTHLALSRRPDTVRYYEKYLRRWIKFAKPYPQTWTRSMFDVWLQKGMDRGWARSTRDKAIQTVRAFVQWMSEEIPVIDITAGHRMGKPRRLQRQTLTPEQVETLLHEARESKEPHFRRLEIPIALAAYLTMRRNDMTVATVGHVDWRRHEIEVQNTKSDQPRRLKLVPLVAEILRRCIPGRKWKRENAYLLDRTITRSWSSANKHLKRLCQKSGVPEVTWHDLRASCCTNMLMGGVDPITVRDAMGHISLATTNLYAQSRPIEDAKAIERALSSRRDLDHSKVDEMIALLRELKERGA